MECESLLHWHARAHQQARAGARHVHGGRDGGVEQEALVRREAGVGDGPAQVAAVHVLAQPPAAVRLVQPDAPVVLERACTPGGIHRFQGLGFRVADGLMAPRVGVWWWWRHWLAGRAAGTKGAAECRLMIKKLAGQELGWERRPHRRTHSGVSPATGRRQAATACMCWGNSSVPTHDRWPAPLNGRHRKLVLRRQRTVAHRQTRRPRR